MLEVCRAYVISCDNSVIAVNLLCVHKRMELCVVMLDFINDKRTAIFGSCDLPVITC